MDRVSKPTNYESPKFRVACFAGWGQFCGRVGGGGWHKALVVGSGGGGVLLFLPGLPVEPMAKFLHCVRTACALRGHCVHTAHAKAGILTQEYLSPDWLHSEATKPT